MARILSVVDINHLAHLSAQGCNLGAAAAATAAAEICGHTNRFIHKYMRQSHKHIVVPSAVDVLVLVVGVVDHNAFGQPTPPSSR